MSYAALPKLYVIADAGVLKSHGLTLRAFASELREAGVTLVQWRAKECSPLEILEGAAILREQLPGCTLIMNDRADLAVLAGFDGVHVGQGDLSPADAKSIFQGAGRGLTGVSTHMEAEVQLAQATDVDYVAIGPVFGTLTKSDAAPAVGLEGVRTARLLTRKPLVGIGGITLQNYASVLAAGADSVAVISGLFIAGRRIAEVAQEFLREPGL